MFIPIDAKADIQGSKKGKLTPAQHAQLNAWCLSNKTGILDCLSNCVYDTTKTSLVPSADKKVTIIFKSGYIVICGRLVECEEGTEFVLNVPVVGSEDGYIVARYNLSSNKEEEFEIVQKTKNDGLIQQDLNDNVFGVYELVLYEYKATTSSVVLTRNIDYVPDIGGKLNQFITVLTGTGVVGQGNPPLQSYDKSKGTIEERLTRLGFKKGSVTFNVDATATQNTIKRQGNYVLLDFSLKYNGYQPKITSFSGKLPTVDKNGNPVSFAPKEEITLLGSHSYVISGGIGSGGSATMTIKTNGDFEVKISTAYTQAFSMSTSFVNVGYEAQPITN